MAASSAQAAEGDPMHHTADKELWHRKENIVELFGHAVVSQPGETLSAEHITLDLNTRTLDARGTCVYVSSGNVIYGDEMHFNLDTRTGTVIGGRVSNDRFTLSGERINKLGDGRFQTHWGEYSTCVDCPNAWSILAEDVDMQVEGYAYMSNVTAKVKDTSAFWLPYMIVPMKTQRQTGLLFPAFTYSSLNGWQIVLPYFWAINRSADMTIAAGTFTDRGPRFTWEGRYALREGSGQANFYFLRDRTFQDGYGSPLSPNRFGVDVKQVQQLPWGLVEKLRFTDVSDNLYPTKVGDVSGSGELNLASSASLAYAGPDVSAYVAFRRYRTLISTVPDPALALTQFDPRTVQQFPAASVSANDRLLFGLPIVYGLNLGISNFTRSGEAFDYDSISVPFGTAIPTTNIKYNPGVDPIRKATRLSVTPSIYTSMRPFDLFAVTPSLKYFYYWYTFPASPGFQGVNNLNRGYLLFQTDLTAQLERVYEFPEDKDQPRTKHLIRPLATYSYIPGAPFLREDPEHPFLKQIANANSTTVVDKDGRIIGQHTPFSGYNFDDYDIVPRDNSPLTANYFLPLGNSLNLGVTTQWIRRYGAVDSPAASYSKFIEASAGEAINFREYDKGADQQPLSRFFQSFYLNLDRFAYSHTYYYYPYLHGIRHAISTSASYSLANETREGIYQFNRSFGVSYNYDKHGTSNTSNMNFSLAYSLSDYFLPSGNLSYDFIQHKFQSAGLQLSFQSPARCWRFGFNATYSISALKADSDSLLNGFGFTGDLSLNLTGSGFGGITDIANQATANK
jgi:lipopolysaccharide assembly outer membrane protein LptD (OstA)